ncbi:histidine kinase N-terminal 7TM domain-containing protein [Chloroflexota bacterium]
MNLFILVPIICAAINSTLAVIALLKPTRARVIFALYLTAGAGWSFTSAMAHSGFDHETTYMWAKLIGLTGTSMMVLYYHFVLRFTEKRPGKLLYIGYGSWLTITIFAILGYVQRDAYSIDGRLFIDYDNHIGFYAVSIYSMFFMSTAIFHLIKHYHNSTDKITRNRTIYLLLGIACFALFGFTDLAPPLLRYPLDYVGGVLNGLIISYVIMKYQLLDIKIVARKGLVYSGLTIIITTTYLMLIVILQTVFHEWVGYTSLLIAGILALSVAIVFNPLRDFLQKRIDHIFYRQTYDYRQMLINFSNKISNVLDLDELADNILEPIVNNMHVNDVALLFPAIESGSFNTRFSLKTESEETPSKLKLYNDNPIVTWLANEGKVLRQEMIDVIPQFKGLWEVERVAIDALGVEMFCPIRSKGKLIGILALGQKQSDTSFSDEEADLLMAMANEAAVVVDNARMLDSLKSQQLQVEQLLAQVVLAQEEERNRISIDLHDGVAQWLVAASYRIQSFSHGLTGKESSETRDDLTNMESTINKSLKELRRVVIGLRPPALDELGLSHALMQSLEDLKVDGIECNFSQDGTLVRLPSSMEIAAYRVVQETLSNIRKHAKASKVELYLQFLENNLMVEIRDNGKGFDLSQTLGSAISVGHMGLLGMKQRAEMLGGDIRIKTREGKGTIITLTLPIPHQEEA